MGLVRSLLRTFFCVCASYDFPGTKASGDKVRQVLAPDPLKAFCCGGMVWGKSVFCLGPKRGVLENNALPMKCAV